MSYGFDPTVKGSATNLLERRYGVRHKGGPWMSLDGQEPGELTSLSEAECSQTPSLIARWPRSRRMSLRWPPRRVSRLAPSLRRTGRGLYRGSGSAGYRAGDMGSERAGAMASDVQTWIALGVAAMRAAFSPPVSPKGGELEPELAELIWASRSSPWSASRLLHDRVRGL